MYYTNNQVYYTKINKNIVDQHTCDFVVHEKLTNPMDLQSSIVLLLQSKGYKMKILFSGISHNSDGSVAEWLKR